MGCRSATCDDEFLAKAMEDAIKLENHSYWYSTSSSSSSGTSISRCSGTGTMNEYAECCGKAKTATRECLHVLTEAGTPSRDRRQCDTLYYTYTVAFTRYAQTSLALARPLVPCAIATTPPCAVDWVVECCAGEATEPRTRLFYAHDTRSLLLRATGQKHGCTHLLRFQRVFSNF